MNVSTKDKTSLRIPQEANVCFTFRPRNIFFSVNSNSKTLFTSSVGCIGYKNSLKRSTLAAEELMKNVMKRVYDAGLRKINVCRLKGFNQVRHVALRKFLDDKTFSFMAIEETTSMPFGGCKPKKRNRKHK